ncbi:MAG: glycosyltransferase family 4 protein [Thermomicrobiales bacterium]|nr:glycosyltransferase family 4 protein [Thermomicrobiales bacterium]
MPDHRETHTARAATGANDRHPVDRPRRVLFVFWWLVIGGEETEVRHLARHLDPARYRLEVIACLRMPGMPEQTHAQLEALGVPVDRAPYRLSFADTIDYLAQKLPAFDLVVGCQAVADLYPALERLPAPPPLIEHGGLVAEAAATPKHLTARYVGVCSAIRDAAAAMMPDRPQHALVIPSMVDLSEFDRGARNAVRAGWGIDDETPVIGWVGRLDRKKRVEDFLQAAAILHARRPEARFVVIGGEDAFMPAYAAGLQALARGLGLDGALAFLGDRPDVPRLLAGLDAFAWLARGEGLPHVILEAGAAGLPIVATPDAGTRKLLEDGETAIFVPHEDPEAVAGALDRLLADRDLAHSLGGNLRHLVERAFAVEAVVPRWTALFDEVLAESRGECPTAEGVRATVDQDAMARARPIPCRARHPTATTLRPTAARASAGSSSMRRVSGARNGRS